MNLNFINKEFERLETLQECIDYQFEPKSKNIGGKRNIYYDDLKLDFVNEVNTFGFSPFILEGFEKQRKNPNVMRYMDKKFNHGLTNYVRKQNDQVKYKEEVRFQQEKKQKKKETDTINTQAPSSIHLKRKETTKVAKKETFLRKALENLAHNKLNLSNEEDNLFDQNNEDDELITDNNKNEKTEDIQKMLLEANKKRILEQLREKYFKSIRDQPENLPKITIADFGKPNALKVNFENLFIKKNKKGMINEKKIVALSKNKDYLFSGINRHSISKTEANKKKSIDRRLNTLSAKNPTNKKLSTKKRVKFWFEGGAGRTLTQSNAFHKNTNDLFNSHKKNSLKSQTISHSSSNKDKYMLFAKAKKYKDSNSPKKPTTDLVFTE